MLTLSIGVFLAAALKNLYARSAGFGVMSTNIIASWSFSTTPKDVSWVIPDGCRDVIFRQSAGTKPRWSVSPLFDRARKIESEAHVHAEGFRIRAGAFIMEDDLLKELQKKSPADRGVKALIEYFVRRDAFTEHALARFKNRNTSLSADARVLNISVRQMQRYLNKTTGRSPTYWKQLARIRASACVLMPSSNLSALAYRYGFSDQSHMTREYKRWFAMTPSLFQKSTDCLEQSRAPGYQ